MRVVLAHSSPERRARFARVLTEAGHEVDETDSADAAVATCLQTPPDVAVVDAALEERGVLGALKADADAYRSAVLLVEPPGLGLDDARSALRAGVQDFLIEPVTDAELLARVESAGRTKVLQQELLEQAQRLERLLFEDPLTGLSNRRFILTQLNGAVSGARRHGRPLSIAVIDIDHFKAINDRHGHAAGDEVLARVSAAMRGRLRAEDQLGRLGGEEFLALLPDAAAGDAEVITEALRAAVAGAEPGGRAVTVSIGWATWGGKEGPDELLRRADDALYAAKGAGRDRVHGAPATVPRRT
jgi:two-component system, cell cycle response regulator